VAPKALGGVAGIVGAGGNVGAVLAGFLMKGTGGNIVQTLTILSLLVLVASLCAIAARFTLTAQEPSATPAVSAA
jgi:NNP family nitrate/nitrite transporter-like MFS transporter